MKILKIVGLFFLIIFVLFISSSLILNSSFPKIETPVSILILGKGGEGHTAPDLTDTMMLTYLNSNNQSVKLLSLPRDIWIAEIRAKLNSAYHYGGFSMASDSVKSVTGIPIDYTVVIDFSMFRDLIDSVGGIDVTIENSFVDEKYPIEGKENDLCNGDKTFTCRYETLQFTQGKQNMNGELALKFVRSRNADGDEGTDIAREKRQQKVIEAIKQKLFSKDVILNPFILKNLYEITISHLETDIDKTTLFSLVRFLFESKNNIIFLNIPDEVIEISQNNKKYDYQYVFVPKSGSWKELQEWITNQVQLPTVLPSN
ncbi:MAG: LCP family protein [Patescibacteria group bacterium]